MLNTSFLRMICTNLQRKSQDRHNWINFSPNLCQRRMHHKRLHRTEYPLHQLLNHVLPLSPKLPLKMNHIASPMLPLNLNLPLTQQLHRRINQCSSIHLTPEPYNHRGSWNSRTATQYWQQDLSLLNTYRC